jgi:hypothetical protein
MILSDFTKNLEKFWVLLSLFYNKVISRSSSFPHKPIDFFRQSPTCGLECTISA